MRGTGRANYHKGRYRRFIPAHAGNRHSASVRASRDPVHPRACGEQLSLAGVMLAATGSSPRMRGTDRPRPAPQCRGRFIPAHAGNRSASVPVAASATVHPRACGEQVVVEFRQSRGVGSSPRMRGTEPASQSRNVVPRFIPAHAGNRCEKRKPPNFPPVHPRACGEQGDRLD